MIYYSKETGGFYDSEVHGARQIEVDEWPKIEINGELVNDPEAVPTKVTISNQNCKIPVDAVEITPEEYDILLSSQTNGKVISYDEKSQKPIFSDYVPTDEEIAKKEKRAKAEALEKLTVTISTGKTFDGNESARVNMLSAITAAAIIGKNESKWRLADNIVKKVTLDELKEALSLSIQRVGEIVTG